jgi:hypothetical protein
LADISWREGLSARDGAGPEVEGALGRDDGEW